LPERPGPGHPQLRARLRLHPAPIEAPRARPAAVPRAGATADRAAGPEHRVASSDPAARVFMSRRAAPETGEVAASDRATRLVPHHLGIRRFLAVRVRDAAGLELVGDPEPALGRPDDRDDRGPADGVE